jgi:hypothetical protein
MQKMRTCCPGRGPLCHPGDAAGSPFMSLLPQMNGQACQWIEVTLCREISEKNFHVFSPGQDVPVFWGRVRRISWVM